MNGYDLSRMFWDWAFDNPEKISPNHAAIYFFAVEHCNRLGWKEKFGFPSQMTMDAIGIKKHSTYIRYFNDLVEWEFFILIQKSTNQYSANIISFNNDNPKKGKALSKAIAKHGEKQTEPIGQSKRSIDKPKTIELLNQELSIEGKSFFTVENEKYLNPITALKKLFHPQQYESWQRMRPMTAMEDVSKSFMDFYAFEIFETKRHFKNAFSQSWKILDEAKTYNQTNNPERDWEKI